jgi:hypothetical protein
MIKVEMKSSMFSSVFSSHHRSRKDEIDDATKCGDFNLSMIYLTNQLFGDADGDDDKDDR